MNRIKEVCMVLTADKSHGRNHTKSLCQCCLIKAMCYTRLQRYV